MVSSTNLMERDFSLRGKFEEYEEDWNNLLVQREGEVVRHP